jgi:hypothetical protein
MWQGDDVTAFREMWPNFTDWLHGKKGLAAPINFRQENSRQNLIRTAWLGIDGPPGLTHSIQVAH